MPSSYASILISTAVICGCHALETPFQDVPAYSAILTSITAAAIPYCVTECVITPSDMFKTKYKCDPKDPVSCICADGDRSTELKNSMTKHCYEKCDARGTSPATRVLQDYCAQYTGAFTTRSETSMVTSSPTTVSITGTATSSTAKPDPTPTSIPKPDPDDLSKGDLAGIVIGSITALIAVVALVLAFLQYRYIQAQSRLEPVEQSSGRWFWQRHHVTDSNTANGTAPGSHIYALENLIPERMRLTG